MGLLHADGAAEADSDAAATVGARRERFAHWLSARLGKPIDADAISERRPSGGGWSNDTVIVEVAHESVAVLRMQPEGAAMFPDYDLAREQRLLSLLARYPEVLAPRLIGADLTGELFGRSMIAMAFVPGHVPADDRPSFAEAGWLFDAPRATQRRFHELLIASLAALHRVPVHEFAAALGASVPVSLAATLDALEQVWRWDRGDRWPTVLDTCFSALRTRQPMFGVCCALWGDARPANMIVGEDFCTPVALLDWELASVGPPALDVAWLLEMNRMRTLGAGVPMLPGFPGDDESVAIYERLAGRKLHDMLWYRLFSALKMAVLMHRFLRVSVHRGRLDAGHRVLGDTVASRRVSDLLAQFTRSEP